VKGRANIFGHNSKVSAWNEDPAWHPYKTQAYYVFYQKWKE